MKALPVLRASLVSSAMDASGPNRDSLRTRRRLLDAARERFKSSAYGDVALRQIAADAGVDPSLISRYFGSKRTLYQEVIAEVTSGLSAFDGPRDSLGDRLAAAILEGDDNDVSHAGRLLLCAIGSPEAERIAVEAARSGQASLRDWLARPDAAERAFLISSLMTGAILQRDITADGDVRLPGFRRSLARLLQTCLTATEPACEHQ